MGLMLLGALYILQLVKNDYIHQIEDKDKDKGKNKVLKIIENIERIIIITFFVVLVMGFILYMGEKKIEYKNNFNYITFMFGKPSCRGKSPEVNYIEAFRSAFTPCI